MITSIAELPLIKKPYSMKQLYILLSPFAASLRKNLIQTLALIVCCLLNTAASAQTTISASTLSSAHWTLAGSPYLITGHIIVANDDSLVIDPGVVVEFQGKYKLFCNGKIIANGTAGQRILFTTTAANQSTGWLGIRYDNTPSTNGRSFFKYCIFEYGRADVTGDDKGGAFYFRNFSNCEISNSVIRNCYAKRGGGAISGMYSSPTILQDSFINNEGDTGGWGVELVYSSSTIDGCYFTGSGVYTGASSLYIANNHFYKCTYEGGISCFSDVINGYLQIIHNVFDSCSQENGGGGGAILLFNAQAKIEHNIFKNNVSICGGGAISCFTQTAYPNSYLVNISNNLFYGNKAHLYPIALASFGGGAISFSNCSGNVINNTIVNNTSDTAGGAIFCGYNSSPTFYNNIIVGNPSVASGEDIFVLDNNSDPGFYHNNLQGGYSAINTNGTPLVGANVNNINAAPGFINPAAGNYMLSSGSPCIDAGTSIGIGSIFPALDLAGNRRITNAGIDMGAYETAGIGVGISQNNSITSLRIVPNPAVGYFEIMGAQLSDIKAIQVLDLLGRQVARFDNVASNHFDVSNFAAGIVLVRVIYKDESVGVVRLLKN